MRPRNESQPRTVACQNFQLCFLQTLPPGRGAPSQQCGAGSALEQLPGGQRQIGTKTFVVTLSRRPVPDRQSTWFRVRCHLPPGLLQEHLRTLFDFLLSSIHKGSGRETLAEPPVMDGSVWHWCPRRVLQEQLRTLLIFSPSIQERAAGRRWRGPTVHGSGMAPGSQTVARTFAYLIQFFSARLLG